jgi:ferredoxin--NADP+ reductase
VEGRLSEPERSPEDLLAVLRERTRVVDYTGWEAIDSHERSLGEPSGRPRVKLVRRDELLERASR